MIMIWNRKEVYMGNSLERFEKVRDALKGKIEFTYRSINKRDPASSRGRINIPFTVDTLPTIYYIYVHYKDYDKAMIMIKSIRS